MLDGMTNWVNVRKYYKLGTSSRAKGGAMVNGSEPGIAAHDKREIDVQILGAMALRGAS